MNAAIATPVAAADLRGGSVTPGADVAAAAAPGSTLAELHAAVAVLAMLGLSDAERRPWDILVSLVPWYAQASSQTIDAVWAMTADRVLAGLSTHLRDFVDEARFDAILAEIAQLVPQIKSVLR